MTVWICEKVIKFHMHVLEKILWQCFSKSLQYETFHKFLYRVLSGAASLFQMALINFVYIRDCFLNEVCWIIFLSLSQISGFVLQVPHLGRCWLISIVDRRTDVVLCSVISFSWYDESSNSSDFHLILRIEKACWEQIDVVLSGRICIYVARVLFITLFKNIGVVVCSFEASFFVALTLNVISLLSVAYLSCLS